MRIVQQSYCVAPIAKIGKAKLLNLSALHRIAMNGRRGCDDLSNLLCSKFLEFQALIAQKLALFGAGALCNT